MRLWSKKRGGNRELPSFITGGLMKFNEKLIRLAQALQQKTNRYSSRTKKLLLLAILIPFTVGSMVILIQGIRGGNKASMTIARIQPIPIQRGATEAPTISQLEFFRIQRFKQHIDSLSKTAKGRRLRDSLLSGHPHLMDSVNFLINLYLQQSKNKQK